MLLKKLLKNLPSLDEAIKRKNKKKGGLGDQGKKQANLKKAKKDMDEIQKKPAPKTAGGGVKKKGRLPSKKIINKLGNVQTVYYRPDKKTKSRYINPDEMNTADLMVGYGDSFKRMLFRDHDQGSQWSRGKGEKNQAQGNEITEKLDKLADEFSFTEENFDQKWETLIRNNYGDADVFLNKAKDIYAELYSVDGKKPGAFINSIFELTSAKIGKKGNEKALKKVIENKLPQAKQGHLYGKINVDELLMKHKDKNIISNRKIGTLLQMKFANMSSPPTTTKTDNDDKKNDLVKDQKSKFLKAFLKNMQHA